MDQVLALFYPWSHIWPLEWATSILIYFLCEHISSFLFCHSYFVNDLFFYVVICVSKICVLLTLFEISTIQLSLVPLVTALSGFLNKNERSNIDFKMFTRGFFDYRYIYFNKIYHDLSHFNETLNLVIWIPIFSKTQYNLCIQNII